MYSAAEPRQSNPSDPHLLIECSGLCAAACAIPNKRNRMIASLRRIREASRTGSRSGEAPSVRVKGCSAPDTCQGTNRAKRGSRSGQLVAAAAQNGKRPRRRQPMGPSREETPKKAMVGNLPPHRLLGDFATIEGIRPTQCEVAHTPGRP